MGRTRRSKKHSHVEANGSDDKPVPSTFVMERGKVGRTLGQLVLDLRRVMEPHTASKLKVRHRNVLKDFVQVAGPLGVSHFIVLSRTETHVNLRLCRLPRGPTVTFHVNNFCLTRDVLSNLRKPVTALSQFMTAPLLVLNNFSPEDKPSKVMATMLQNMFPSLNIQTVKLANINRCVLFNYNAEDRTVEFRHYNIRAVARGISRGVKRLGKHSVPNLSKYADISDYMLGGHVSESEGEEMAGQEVTLPQDLPGRGNTQSTQSAVKLTELGPRLTLRLVKVEAGLCEGEVLHHEFIHKSKKEARDVRKRVKETQRVLQQRRQQQDANVTRKMREKEQHKQRCLDGNRSRDDEEDGTSGNSSGSDGEDDDREWYRQEVGEEPDPDMLVPSGSQSRKRGRQPNTSYLSGPAKRHRGTGMRRGGRRSDGGGREGRGGGGVRGRGGRGSDGGGREGRGGGGVRGRGGRRSDGGGRGRRGHFPGQQREDGGRGQFPHRQRGGREGRGGGGVRGRGGMRGGARGRGRPLQPAVKFASKKAAGWSTSRGGEKKKGMTTPGRAFRRKANSSL